MLRFAEPRGLFRALSPMRPGLDLRATECGVHAIDSRTGKILGSLVWPLGNQIFSIEWLPARMSHGFPFEPGRAGNARYRDLFYNFQTQTHRSR